MDKKGGDRDGGEVGDGKREADEEEKGKGIGRRGM